MNENQSEQLCEELFQRFEHVQSYSEDTINFEVRISGRVKAVPPIPNCDNCSNQIICLVYRKIIEIAPILAMATLNSYIGDYIKQTVSKECKRFQR